MRYPVAQTLILWLAFIATGCAQPLQVKRWQSAEVAPLKAAAAGRIVDRILREKSRYEQVDAKSSVPWYVVSGLHNMESAGSFAAHLHEGSPLTGRTRFVPKGRPVSGKPPFRWEDSAVDALKYDRMGSVDWSSLDATLYACERYNGLGYLKYHPETPTQYLYAATTLEKPGKFFADGKWSSTARSSQIGIVAIWKTMEKRGILNFNRLK